MKFYLKILQELRSEPHTMRTVYKHAFSFSDEVAFEYSRNLIIHRVTYAECRKEVQRISCLLKDKCRNEEIIAIVMQNSPLWIECFWAVLMSGKKVMPVSPEMPLPVLKQCLGQAGCRALLGDVSVDGCRCISCEELLNGYCVQVPVEEPETGWGDEVILTTSGTTGRPEVFSYTGKEICSQILNSNYVLDHSKDISRFWKGHIKQLAFLPFSHIFGLTACYLWFVIFGLTFVFLEDYAPSTILRTCRLHQVTHIFAVPLLWDSLASGIRKEAESAGLTAKLEKGIRISTTIQNASPFIGRLLVPVLMKKIRRETLGDSISFCISGGGACNKDTFRIVNGCGYHLENGYGMTEIGIACVTLKKKAGDRDGKTVGKIFPSLNTSLSSNGHLMVKGDSCFAYRYADGVPVPRDTEAWFDTGDCFDTEKDGELLFKGREDDLINSSDGERINPETIESLLSLTFPVCVVCLSSNVLTMLVGASGGDYVSKERRMQVVEAVNHAVEKLPVHMRPRRVLYTYETIPVSLSFKYRRKEITRLLEQELLTACNAEEFISPEGRQTAAEEENAVVNEIIGITKDILNCTDEVTPVSNFFTDLGGDSLSYIEYLNALETHFRIRIPKEETGKCVSPLSVYHVIAGAAKTER